MTSVMLLAIVFSQSAKYVDDGTLLPLSNSAINADAALEAVTSSPDQTFAFDFAAAPILAMLIDDVRDQNTPTDAARVDNIDAQTFPTSRPSVASAPEPFGSADSAYWHINLGVGDDFDERTITRLGVGLGYFITEDVSLDWDLALAYVEQPGDDAFAINLGMLLRWHFLHDQDKSWTLYGEAGAGLLGATDDIPANGTSFNFTPQVGFGATVDLGESFAGGGCRLFTGIRWFHISNANTFEDNPAVDFAMLHATVTFPF